MATQILFRRTTETEGTLRSRKKERVRYAIQDAALDLFSEQGYEAVSIEQIVARADTSVTTFFRYFRGKADILVSDDGTQLRVLQQCIIDRPKAESDIIAVCEALLAAWVREVADSDRIIRMAAAVESSALLLGLRYEVTRVWIGAVADALARRSRKKSASRQHKMVARIVLGVFGDSVEEWIANECRGELRRVVKRDFDMLMLLHKETASVG